MWRETGLNSVPVKVDDKETVPYPIRHGLSTIGSNRFRSCEPEFLDNAVVADGLANDLGFESHWRECYDAIEGWSIGRV